MLSSTYDLSSTSYDVMFLVVLLRHFIYMRVIQTDKTDSISHMVVYMLKNWSRKYFSYYIIKFIGFIPLTPQTQGFIKYFVYLCSDTKL